MQAAYKNCDFKPISRRISQTVQYSRTKVIISKIISNC